MTTATISTTRDHAADLLAVLALDKGLVEVKAIRPTLAHPRNVKLFWYDGPAALLRDFQRMEALNREGWGVYYGVATYNERQGTKDRAAWLWTVHADLDGKDYADDWRTGKLLALDMLANLPERLAPAVMVDSGHGYHAYWPLSEPLEATPANIKAVEAANGALAAFLGSDPAVKDASRVMRLPGLVNTKDGEPLPVVVFGGIDGRRFDVADFQAIMPAKQAQQAQIGSAGESTGRPGDDFNARGDWSDLLSKHGWKEVGRRGETSFWCRPGKDAGISARLNKGGDGLLYVYSSNAGALAAGQSYTLFGAYAALEHGGNFREAANSLVGLGYGTALSSNGNGNGRQITVLSDDDLAAPVVSNDADFQPGMLGVPELPAAARLPEQLGADAGAWLSDYVSYASSVSERTPDIIHQAAGLYLASVAVARRLYLPMRHADVFPNLYILPVAPTTLYAKTTGLGVMTSLLDDAMPHLQLSNESTPEALLAELAGREPPNLDSKEISDEEREVWKLSQRFAAQRGLVLEEASALLAGMKREYMQGMAELLLRLYDCPRLYRRHTRGGGYAMIRTAYLSFCGWTTPARLRTAEIETGWQDGLFARFALVTPAGPPTRPADDGYMRERPTRPTALLEDLSRLANSLLPTPDEFPKPVVSRPVTIEGDARAAWYRYYQATSYDLLTGPGAPDARLHGTYGRLSTSALKVSLLLAALDWSRSGDAGDPVVTLAHYAAAQRIAEDWRASAHRLLNTLSAKPEAEEEDRDLRRLLAVLERTPGQWMALRDVVRSLPSKQYTTATISGLLRILMDDGRVEAAEHKPEGRGRPSMRYRIVSM